MKSDERMAIDVDDDLLAKATSAAGARTGREAVELGLLALVRLKRLERIREHRGKLTCTGDLEKMRGAR